MTVPPSTSQRSPLIRPALFIAVLLAAVQLQALDITLAWDAMAPEEGVLHYTVYMDNGGGSKVFDVAPCSDEPTLRVRGLVPGVRYQFHVTATSLWGESPPSNLITYGEVSEDLRRSIRRGSLPSPYKKPELK